MRKVLIWILAALMALSSIAYAETANLVQPAQTTAAVTGIAAENGMDAVLSGRIDMYGQIWLFLLVFRIFLLLGLVFRRTGNSYFVCNRVRIGSGLFRDIIPFNDIFQIGVFFHLPDGGYTPG